MINIKKNWNEVTILEYIQIMDILKTDNDELDKVAGIVSILTNLEMKTILELDLKVFQSLASNIQFINILPTVKLQPIYKIKDTIFKVNYNLNKISTQQYIDMLHLSQKDFITNIHKVLSLFLIPATEKKTILGKKYVTEKYGSYDIEEVADLILNNLTIDIAYELMVFFCKLYDNSMSHTLHYLVNQTILIIWKSKLKWKKKVALIRILRNGVGLTTLIELQKELVELGIKFGK